ncbi:hypothetical protein BC826DRAFT_1082911, partial [Russula brevipes]
MPSSLSIHSLSFNSASQHRILLLPQYLQRLARTYTSQPQNLSSASPRVKDLTTPAFLPTFVDVGYNFGGAIIAEDFMLHQLWEANNV